MKVLVKFTYGSTHYKRVIEGEGKTPENVVENYVNDNCLAQDGYPTAFGRDMLLGEIICIDDIEKSIANATLIQCAPNGIWGTFERRRTKWYHVDADDSCASYTDAEMVERCGNNITIIATLDDE